MENKKIHLKNRKVLKVSGENSIEFLNNILTSDITKLKPRELLPSALLSPQGRILFDMLVSSIIFDNSLYAPCFNFAGKNKSPYLTLLSLDTSRF